jgi:hypothetical protein
MTSTSPALADPTAFGVPPQERRCSGATPLSPRWRVPHVRAPGLDFHLLSVDHASRTRPSPLEGLGQMIRTNGRPSDLCDSEWGPTIAIPSQQCHACLLPAHFARLHLGLRRVLNQQEVVRCAPRPRARLTNPQIADARGIETRGRLSWCALLMFDVCRLTSDSAQRLHAAEIAWWGAASSRQSSARVRPRARACRSVRALNESGGQKCGLRARSRKRFPDRSEGTDHAPCVERQRQTS